MPSFMTLATTCPPLSARSMECMSPGVFVGLLSFGNHANGASDQSGKAGAWIISRTRLQIFRSIGIAVEGTCFGATFFEEQVAFCRLRREWGAFEIPSACCG